MQHALLLALLTGIPTGKGTISNLEATPGTVAVREKLSVPPIDEQTEGTAVHCRLNYDDPDSAKFIYCLYFEVDDDQHLAGGSATKVLHYGRGDAHYVAILGDNTSGYGYEAAMFGGWQNPPTDTIPKQENGFLGSFQGSGGFGESVKNQANSIPFSALVHDDGVDPTDPDDWATNYGLFYAINSLSNAFRVRTSQYASNYPQIAISDTNLRNTWAAYTDGRLYLDGAESDGDDDEHDSPPFKLRGTWWTGAAEQYKNTYMVTGVDGSGVPRLYIYTGTEGSEALQLIIGNSQIDLQGNSLINAPTISATGSAALTLGSNAGASTIKIHATGGVQLDTNTGTDGRAEPVSCTAANAGTMQYVDDTNDSAAAEVCICKATTDDGAGNPTMDWLKIVDDTACTFF